MQDQPQETEDRSLDRPYTHEEISKMIAESRVVMVYREEPKPTFREAMERRGLSFKAIGRFLMASFRRR